jgi:hypothetical protein
MAKLLEFPENPNNLTEAELNLRRGRIALEDSLRVDGILLTDKQLDAWADKELKYRGDVEGGRGKRE